jgi:hypothetical protein
MTITIAVQPRPPGWNPRERPVRWCPVHLRSVHVDEACPRFCGAPYLVECKYADRDPAPHEMHVAQPRVVAEEDYRWVERWRKTHGPP